MKLTDVRKMAIRQQTRVSFRLANSLECVVDEHGIARIAGIRDAPPFNLEEELSGVGEFRLEKLEAIKVAPRTVTRIELEKLTSSRPAAADDEDHDE